MSCCLCAQEGALLVLHGIHFIHVLASSVAIPNHLGTSLVMPEAAFPYEHSVLCGRHFSKAETANCHKEGSGCIWLKVISNQPCWRYFTCCPAHCSSVMVTMTMSSNNVLMLPVRRKLQLTAIFAETEFWRKPIRSKLASSECMHSSIWI